MNALVYARKHAAKLLSKRNAAAARYAEAAKKLEILGRYENTRLSKIFLNKATACEDRGDEKGAERALKAAAYWEKQGQ